MSPLDRMARHAAEHGITDFGYLVELYLREHYVFSTPEYFLMMKPERNLDFPIPKLIPYECDTWYVAAFAGDIAAAWRSLPYELPYLSFHRDRGGKRELTRVSLTRIRGLSLAQAGVIHHEFGQSI